MDPVLIEFIKKLTQSVRGKHHKKKWKREHM